jgi:hypothetical protein
MRLQFVALAVGALVLSLAAGCGGGGKADLPKLVPVSGTVTLDGKPLAGAMVSFIPTGATPGRSMFYGATGADGRYELVYDEKHKGAPEGQFMVLCNKWVMPDGSDFPRDSKVAPMDGGARELLPPRYSLDGTSELRATVKAGGPPIDFKLTSK